MQKGHYDWWIKEIEKKNILDGPESILYQYELGNRAIMNGESMQREALLHYLSGMEAVKEWQTEDTSCKEFYRALLLLAIGDTMQGQIPVGPKEECIDEAERVFRILCKEAKLMQPPTPNWQMFCGDIPWNLERRKMWSGFVRMFFWKIH